MHRVISVLITVGIRLLVVLVEGFVLVLVWCTLGFVVVAGRGRSEVSIPMRLMIVPMDMPILFVTGDANHPHNTHTETPKKMLIASFRDSVSQLS